MHSSGLHTLGLITSVIREQSRSVPITRLPITNRGKRASDHFRPEPRSSFPRSPFLVTSPAKPPKPALAVLYESTSSRTSTGVRLPERGSSFFFAPGSHPPASRTQ